MATPKRTDQPQRARPLWGRRPIVLAQLPRVGVGAENRRAPPELMPPGLTPSAPEPPQYAQAAPAESGAVASRIDGSQINGSQIDGTPSGTRQSATSRGEVLLQTPAEPVPQIAVEQKTDSPILKVLADLAPYAGLVVTLTLIGSAGLLYWLIVGPTQMSLKYQEIAPDRGGWPAQNASAPAFPATSPTAVNSSTPTRPAELSLRGGESAVSADRGFQSTSQAAPLDFSRVRNVFGEESPVALPEPRPALANLPDAEETTSTKNR